MTKCGSNNSIIFLITKVHIPVMMDKTVKNVLEEIGVLW